MHSNSDILKDLFDKVKANGVLNDTKLTCGNKYIAATSAQGNIGVCATLGVVVEPVRCSDLDFSVVNDRIVANALVNAFVNYGCRIDGYGDIFDAINFDRYRSIVMIGYFGPLVNKFRRSDIALNIFDLDQHEVPVLPMEQQIEYLRKADCVILTSTSISNGTFDGIVGSTPLSADIFMLGPSTPMDDTLFEYSNVKGLFGSVFKPFDQDTLGVIAEGGGTCIFKQYMDKVYRVRAK